MAVTKTTTDDLDADAAQLGIELDPEPDGADTDDAKPADDAKPRRRRRVSSAAKSDEPKRLRGRPSRASIAAELEPKLTELFTTSAFALSMVNPADGEAVLRHAPAMGRAWAQLAAENDAVRRALNALLTTSAWGAVIMATAPLVLELAANHEMLPHQRKAKRDALAAEESTNGAEASPDQDAYAWAGGFGAAGTEEFGSAAPVG